MDVGSTKTTTTIEHCVLTMITMMTEITASYQKSCVCVVLLASVLDLDMNLVAALPPRCRVGQLTAKSWPISCFNHSLNSKLWHYRRNDVASSVGPDIQCFGC